MSKVALDCDSTALLLSVCEGNASSNEIDPDMYPTTCLIFLSFEPGTSLPAKKCGVRLK